MRSAIGMAIVMVALAGCKDNAETTTTSAASASASASATPLVASASASVSQPTPEQEAADEENAANQLRTHHRHHHHGGVAMFVHMAIDTLGVPAEKKAQLQKIQSDLHTAMAPARDAHKALVDTLADGVAAGNIDKAKVDAATAKVQAAAAGVHAASQDALNALHAALSPAERTALADKVQAHADVWKKVNIDEEHGSKEKGTHLQHMSETLQLTPDQVDKISTALKTGAPPKPDHAPIAAYVTAFVKAFPTDTFDAKTFNQANAANGAIAKHGTARMVRFYTIVTPILTPDQRTKLAAHLRERGMEGHSGATPAGAPQ
jgi:Spy/CpxP family protein refolding chaperone